MINLRLNLGDRSEARLYYLPHALAEAHGLFAREGLRIEFLHAAAGGDGPMGGQLGAVVAGEADLAVGGPMVTMKLQAEGVEGLVSFCALVRTNPWVIAGRPQTGVLPGMQGLGSLRGQVVRDVGNVATARLCFEHGRGAAGLEAAELPLLPGSGDEQAELAACAAGSGELVHHSLHALAPWIAAGRLSTVLAMADVTGPVPWSAYIARADALVAQPGAFAAFRRALHAALLLVARDEAAAIAAAVAPHYPGYDRAALAWAIGTYRDLGLWSPDPQIPRAEFARFGEIMRQSGWLPAAPRVDALIAHEIAA